MLKKIFKGFSLFISAFVGVVSFFSFPAFSQDSSQLLDKTYRVVLHAHSEVSGDDMPLDEIAFFAAQRGIDAVILTDYFQRKVSYGGFSWNRLFKWTQERPSIKKSGVQNYYNHVRSINERHSDVTLIPGAEVAPFYWWSGNPLTGSLTVHDLQKNVLVFGLEPEGLDQIPSIENSKPLFNAYAPRKNFKADQKVIDHVANHLGFSVWSTPDEAFGADFKIGTVRLWTPPYTQALIETKDYQGIALYPEGLTKSAPPGGVWDNVLMDYCRGRRKAPIWAFAEGVVHDHNMKENFGKWDQQVIAVDSSEKEILSGLRKGNFYIRKMKQGTIRIDRFDVQDALTGEMGTLGQEVLINNQSVISISVHVEDVRATGLEVELIYNGQVVHVEKASDGQSLSFEWQEPEILREGTLGYYRITGRTLSSADATFHSNPIFVRREAE